MVIYTQNRKMIIEMPPVLKIIKYEDCFGITTGVNDMCSIGKYENESRAQEVLNEIFSYCKNGKNSFIMPEE